MFTRNISHVIHLYLIQEHNLKKYSYVCHVHDVLYVFFIASNGLLYIIINDLVSHTGKITILL